MLKKNILFASSPGRVNNGQWVRKDTRTRSDHVFRFVWTNQFDWDRGYVQQRCGGRHYFNLGRCRNSTWNEKTHTVFFKIYSTYLIKII